MIDQEKVKIYVSEGAIAPSYGTENAAGADFYAWFYERPDPTDKDAESVIVNETEIHPGEMIKVHTGIYMEIPEGCYLAIVPRSGMACKRGVTVINTPGTIDSDYRGEIVIVLVNLGKEAVLLGHNERVAQGILKTYTKADFEQVYDVSQLSSTERGIGGFGSTGKF